MMPVPSEKLSMPQVNQPANNEINPMGDKSPKSKFKQSSQKQAKVSSADQKKKQAAAAKSAAVKKR
jgi:hypothetical protein